jgi:hypothetical protein
MLPNVSLQPTGTATHHYERALIIATQPGFPPIAIPPAAELGRYMALTHR